jgi:hypothetical protein
MASGETSGGGSSRAGREAVTCVQPLAAAASTAPAFTAADADADKAAGSGVDSCAARAAATAAFPQAMCLPAAARAAAAAACAGAATRRGDAGRPLRPEPQLRRTARAKSAARAAASAAATWRAALSASSLRISASRPATASDNSRPYAAAVAASAAPTTASMAVVAASLAGVEPALLSRRRAELGWDMTWLELSGRVSVGFSGGLISAGVGGAADSFWSVGGLGKTGDDSDSCRAGNGSDSDGWSGWGNGLAGGGVLGVQVGEGGADGWDGSGD